MELLEKTKNRKFDEYKNLFDTVLNSEANTKAQSQTGPLFANQNIQQQNCGLFGSSPSFEPMSQMRGFGGLRGRGSSQLRAFNAPLNNYMSE
jgi:hypothetical protein